MTLFNYILDNNYVIYGLFTTTAGFIGYLVIKSYFYPNIIQTPNSAPQTFNFNLEQLKEIQDILDEGDRLDKETNNKLDQLDQEIQNILGEENYAEFNPEIQEFEDQFSQELPDIFNNIDSSDLIQSGIDYNTISQLIDITTNLF